MGSDALVVVEVHYLPKDAAPAFAIEAPPPNIGNPPMLPAEALAMDMPPPIGKPNGIMPPPNDDAPAMPDLRR